MLRGGCVIWPIAAGLFMLMSQARAQICPSRPKSRSPTRMALKSASSTLLTENPSRLSAAAMEVVPAPAGVWAVRDVGLSRYLPSGPALVRSYSATYELLGEPVRELLSLVHLRRQ